MPNQRTSKLMTFSMPPSLYREAIRAAREEGRTNSELVRESVRKYIADRRWRKLLDYGRRKALETGLRPDEIEDIIDELRDNGT
mgnify:CR=1 FL=1